jgi:hypothetical protein
MADLTGLLEQIRGEVAPVTRLDPRADGQPAFGNPNRRPKGERR